MGSNSRRMSVEARQAQLIATGIEAFAEHGAWGLSLEQIAARAGTSKGLVLHYFGSKKGFFAAVVEAVVTEISRITAPDPDLSFGAALRGSIARFVDYVESNPAVLRLVRAEFGPDPEVHTRLEELRQLEVARTLERLGVTEIRPELQVALRGWIAFAETATLAWVETGGFEKEALIEMIRNAALNAIASAPAARITSPSAA